MNHVYRLLQGKLGRKTLELLKKGYNNRPDLEGMMGAGIKDAVNKSALNKTINFTLWE